MSALVGVSVEPTDWLRVSYSSLNTFDSCARKFEFNKLYPRRPRDFDAFAADVGSSLHAGYQDFLVNQDPDKAVWEMMQAYPYSLEFQQTKDDRSFEATLSTLEEMIESAAIYDYEVAQILCPDGVVRPAIEVPFEIRLKGITLPDGRGIAYTGFIDAIMRNVVNGLYQTLDIKTHRRHLHDATAKYKFDAQQVPYGIIVDHVAGQVQDSFNVLYLDCYVDLLEPRVQKYPFTKYREDLEDWLLGIVFKAQAIQRYMEMDHFPRTQGGCLFYNKPCYFLDVCETRSRPDIMDWLLMGEEPAIENPPVSWIVKEIDVFGSDSDG